MTSASALLRVLLSSIDSRLAVIDSGMPAQSSPAWRQSAASACSQKVAAGPQGG